MTEAGMDAALLLHHRDILYYAGTVRPAALLVSSKGAVLFVRRGLECARQEATVARVEPMKGFSDIADVAAELGLAGEKIGTELDLVSAQVYRRLGDVFPAWSLADISPLVLAQRAIKDEQELAATRQAVAVADAGHQAARETAAPGVSELELAAEVEAAMRRAGHDGFQPLRHPGARGGGVLLMSGENLSVRGGHGLVVTGVGLGPGLPYGPSRRVLEPGDLVVVDIFAVTRAVEDAVLEALRSGVAAADLYAVAEAAVAQRAVSHFAPGGLTLPGFVGHGIGLELDEPPVLWPRDETHLQAGMVLAIEIELSAPAQRTMIKLEDTVVVGPDGYELLTGTPRELIECE
jgi:Xaa-Pro aminopeptidase